MTRIGLFGSVLAALTLGACGGGSSALNGDDIAEPTAALATDLQFLREEEKLARDVYLTLYERWQLATHANIASSEQTHMDRAKATLANFGLPDPVRDDTVGAFVNADLGQLYGDLIARGEQTEVESLRVGATIEDLDLRDIELMKSRTTDASVLATYEALQCGSRNHLRAFTSQLATRGASYTPQYLNQAAYDAILVGAREQCGR